MHSKVPGPCPAEAIPVISRQGLPAAALQGGAQHIEGLQVVEQQGTIRMHAKNQLGAACTGLVGGPGHLTWQGPPNQQVRVTRVQWRFACSHTCAACMERDNAVTEGQVGTPQQLQLEL